MEQDKLSLDQFRNSCALFWKRSFYFQNISLNIADGLLHVVAFSVIERKAGMPSCSGKTRPFFVELNYNLIFHRANWCESYKCESHSV
jgi:hypothetical protein